MDRTTRVPCPDPARRTAFLMGKTMATLTRPHRSHRATQRRNHAPTATIGLDIGSTSIRAVEVTHSREDRPVIDNFGQAVLPEGAVVGGVVKDEKAVTGALRQLWSAQNFRS